VGKGGHYQLPSRVSAGGLPAADFHDAGSRCGGRLVLQHLWGTQSRRALAVLESKASRKGKGFQQPLGPHEHWHVDISYLNIVGTFFYLCSVLDGCSRFLVHRELRAAMTELDVEIVLQRARERYPGTSPRIITDNGPQFIAKDFKEFIRLAGLTHVKTSPYYPQSNGKIERWHQSLKADCLRPGCPLSQQNATRLIERFVNHYNTVRLHSAIGYVTPADRLAGRQFEIFAERDRKLELTRQNRKTKRQSLTKSIIASSS
jgi:putative transposase